MEVLYEDNHLIIVNKAPGEIVQGDKTGDTPLSETIKAYLKEKYAKPGNVFCGVVHRLDRPVGGVVVFAKTSKALARLNEMFREGKVDKTYWAITAGTPAEPSATLTHYITTRQQGNKSYASATPVADSKKAILHYSMIARGDRYNLLEVNWKPDASTRYVCSSPPSDARSKATSNTEPNAATPTGLYP